MRYRMKVEWESEAGGVESAEVGEVEVGSCLSADGVGLKRPSAKELKARLQELVMKQQLSSVGTARHRDHARDVEFLGTLKIIEHEPLILCSAKLSWMRPDSMALEIAVRGRWSLL